MAEELDADASHTLEPQQMPLSSPANGLERPATVLLSYAHADTEFVKDLQLRLNARGIRSWRDVDDLLVGSPFEDEIVHAIEHDVDAVAIYITPHCLKSNFIWKVEVPAALQRRKRDRDFHIVPLLQGVSFAEVRQFCRKRRLPELTGFHGIELTDDGTNITWEEQNKRRNRAAKSILQAALTLRLRRSKADRAYEASLCLKTFFFEPPTASLDLHLDWLQLVHEKERLPTPREWEEILWPALLDVKQIVSEKILSRRIHVFVKSILPVALAFGFAFRKAAGLTLLLERQKESWSTEEQPSEQAPLLCEFHKNDREDSQQAVVEVATSRSIQQAVADALPLHELTPAFHVRLALPELSGTAVKDAAHAQAIARQVGRVCQDLCDQQRVAHIHLFVAIPVELAVLIGHQLNALCPITLYEFHQKTYQPVGVIQ
jgi:hypothetical protein